MDIWDKRKEQDGLERGNHGREEKRGGTVWA